MASKLNIFNALPNNPSDDEDDHGHKGSQSGQGGAKKDRVRNRGPKKQDGSDPKPTGTAAKQDSKSRDTQLKKARNDLDHPHTLDRKSGTGEQAYGKHDKKGGAGRFNKGTFKDDLRGPRPEGEREGDDDQAGSGEEEDNTVTWDDYYASKNTAETKQQVNDAKAKITDEQLKKELGKATLLQSRVKEVDDRTETRAKKSNATVTGMNTDHAELLGFRTGFKVHDGPKKKPQYEKTGDNKPAEGEKTEGTEEKKDEEKPAEETGAKTEKTEDKSPEGGNKGGYKGGYKGDREGGYKGGYKGDREGGYKGGYKGGDREGGYKGGDKGGYKGDKEGGYKGGDKGGYKGGDKGGYKGGDKGGYNKGPKATFNAEDEKLFPKLG